MLQLEPRTPPHNLEAERATLGSVLMQPTALDELSEMKVDDFFLPAHREIFEAMLEVTRRGSVLDVITLADELKPILTRLEGGETYLLQLANAVATGDSIRHYARIVANKAIQRRLIVACTAIASQAQGDFFDVVELLTDARAQLAAIELPSGTTGPVRISDELYEALSEIERRAANPERHFVLTGIQAFDREISGLCAETLILIAGRPSKGKSALLLNFAQRAARNNIPTLVFSLEMGRLLLIFRALAFEALVNGRSIISGQVSGPEWIRLQSAASRLSTDNLSIDDRSGLSRFAIAAEARRWRAANPSAQALVLVDYLSLVKRTGDVREQQEELGEITADMKKLAKELKLPVVLAAQLNRDSEKENRRPQLKDLRGSGAIEQDADVVIFPWWQGEAPRYGRHPASLIVGKNRNGPTADIEVDWLPEYTMFTDREDLPEPQQRSLL